MSTSKPTTIGVIAFVAIVLAVALLHAKVVYDDFACAFARCVKVKP